MKTAVVELDAGLRGSHGQSKFLMVGWMLDVGDGPAGDDFHVKRVLEQGVSGV
jgi:hypothetical protein